MPCGKPTYRYSMLHSNRNPSVLLNVYDHCFSPKALVIPLAILFLLSTSFVLGRWSVTSSRMTTIPCMYRPFAIPISLPIPSTVATESRLFHYDERFGSFPSNKSNDAWAEIFPTQGGFFKHPSLAPKRSAFSVFHQLHCLVRAPDWTRCLDTITFWIGWLSSRLLGGLHSRSRWAQGGRTKYALHVVTGTHKTLH